MRPIRHGMWYGEKETGYGNELLFLLIKHNSSLSVFWFWFSIMFSRFLQRNLSRGSVLSSHNVTGTTSKARTVVTLTPSSRMVGSSSSLMCRGRSMTSPFVATGSVLPQNLHQQQQERYNWTKAKKKRYARHERRAKLAQGY